MVCPKRISGGARRRFVQLSAVPKSSWTEDEKNFMEYASYVRDARHRYFHEHDTTKEKKKPLVDNKTSSEAAQTSEATPVTVPVPAPAPAVQKEDPIVTDEPITTENPISTNEPKNETDALIETIDALMEGSGFDPELGSQDVVTEAEEILLTQQHDNEAGLESIEIKQEVSLGNEVSITEIENVQAVPLEEKTE